MSSITEAGARPSSTAENKVVDFEKSLKTASQNKSDKSTTNKETQIAEDADHDEFAVSTLPGKSNASSRVQNLKRSRQLLNHYFPEVGRDNFKRADEGALSGATTATVTEDNVEWSTLGKPAVMVGGLTPGPNLQKTGWKQGVFDLISTDGKWTHTGFVSTPVSKRGNWGLGIVGSQSVSIDDGLKAGDVELGPGVTRVIRSKSGDPKGLLWMNLRTAIGLNEQDPELGGLPSGNHYASVNFGIALSPTYAARKGMNVGAKIGKVPTPQTMAVKAVLTAGGKALKKSNDYLTPWVGVGWRGAMDTKTGDVYVKGEKLDIGELVKGTFFDEDSEEAAAAVSNHEEINPSDVILADANADKYYSGLADGNGDEFNGKIGMTREVFRDLSFSEASRSGRRPVEVMRDLSQDLIELKEYYNEAREAGIAPNSALSFSRAVQKGIFDGSPGEWHELMISKQLTEI